MSHDSPVSSEEYVKEGGNKCPFCGATDINGHAVEIDAGIAYQPVDCSECGKEWTDQYSLVGYVV